MNTTKSDIIAYLSTITDLAEVEELAKHLAEAKRRSLTLATEGFSIGNKVSWTDPKLGLLEGIVVKVNLRTVTASTTAPGSKPVNFTGFAHQFTKL